MPRTTRSAEPAPRPRNAAATRAAILAAARAAFVQAGYDRAGVREIAAAAGVDAALVSRYFGSKEGLFLAALAAEPFDLADLLQGERATLGERLVRVVLAKRGAAGAFDPLIALLRSLPDEPAASLLKAAIDDQFVAPLAAWIGGEDAAPRAGLVAAVLLGLAVNRELVGSQAIAEADEALVLRMVAPVVQAYIDGSHG